VSILNNIGSLATVHIGKSISEYCHLPVLGGIPVYKEIIIPSGTLAFLWENGVLENILRGFLTLLKKMLI
jgi:cobyrinic acid a,c-diamide synthase